MNMNKIGVIGSFAAGAALALAPMAAAAPVDPADFSSILVGEVQSMNWLFGAQATLAGVADGVITAGDPTAANPLSFSTISAADLQLPANEGFASLLFGSNWADEMSSDPGSYNLFNGALVQFTDGNNVLLYAMMSGGDQINVADAGDYLIGSDTTIAAALAGDSVWADASAFYTNGFNDMLGYFAMPDVDVTP